MASRLNRRMIYDIAFRACDAKKGSRMGVVARILTLAADRVWRRFEASAAAPEAAQAQVLADLVRRAAATEWGRSVGLAEVRTPRGLPPARAPYALRGGRAPVAPGL